jgi:hypothetical protein
MNEKCCTFKTRLSVTLVVGGRRSRPKRSVVRIHNEFNKDEYGNKSNKPTYKNFCKVQQQHETENNYPQLKWEKQAA